MRTRPNLLITGSPAVGKSTLCEQVLSLLSEFVPPTNGSMTASSTDPDFVHLQINDLVKRHGLYESRDTQLDTLVVDDDKLLDHLTHLLSDGEKGGYLIDWHSCDLFPRKWIDLVIVLRCENTTVLYDRLVNRGYSKEKLDMNLDTEIFGVVAEEALDAFGDWTQDDPEAVKGDLIVELKSETAEQAEANGERIALWIKNWMRDARSDRGRGAAPGDAE